MSNEHGEPKFPPIPKWIIDEAHGDPVLIDLIEQREWLIGHVADQGPVLSDNDKQAATEHRKILEDGIKNRKVELGISDLEQDSEDTSTDE